MIELSTPRGLPVRVPETLAEEDSPRFAPGQLDELEEYYHREGYAVVAGLVPTSLCDRARQLWESEVKPFEGFIYRQATAMLERHVKNDKGWVMNPVLNIQSLDPRRFGKLRRFVVEEIFAAPAFVKTVTGVIGDSPKVVQSMYFEGNSATWEHQDTYYLDSENMGSMCGAWIALEDIAPEAGRFFICPRSHRIILEEHGAANNVAEHHEDYIKSVVERIRSEGLEIKAPALRKGDVLLWNSRTIHGSLNSQDMESSRSSITCHVIPAKDRFLQLQMRPKDLVTDRVDAIQVFRPKDLSKIGNRAIFWLESRFPDAFYRTKALAIRKLAEQSDKRRRRKTRLAKKPNEGL